MTTEDTTITIRYFARILLALLVATALGCGGGGGGGGGTTPPANPTKATLTFSIPSLPAGTQVGGVQFVINLPTGVSPAIFSSCTTSGCDASGSITLTGGGVNLLSATNYISAANTATFAGATTTGFGTGNFLTMNCVIASGTTVTASSFSISNIQVFDTSANLIPSATVNMAVVLS